MELKEVFQPIINFVKGLQKRDNENSKIAAKERLKLVLMQDRASVSPDFFEMMKKEIIEVIKKYIEIDEEALEVQLTRGFEDGLEGPALYANIPIKNIKPIAKKVDVVAEEIKEAKKHEHEVKEDNLEKAQTQEKTGEENTQDDIVDEEENTSIEEVAEVKEECKETSEENVLDEKNIEENEQKEEVKEEVIPKTTHNQNMQGNNSSKPKSKSKNSGKSKSKK